MRNWIVLGSALAVAGCATPYQEMGLTGGYSEQQLAADSYKIHVQTNGYTSVRRANEIALLRASELTLKAGYDRFATVSGEIARRGLFGQVETGSIMYINGAPTSMPSGDLTIRFVKPGDPAYDNAVDAAKLLPLLKADLDVKDGGSPSQAPPSADSSPNAAHNS